MTITKLTVQKKNSSRVSVFLDGEFAFGIHQDLVLQFGLVRGKTLTVEEQEAIQQADRLAQAKGVAFGYLAHRPRTEYEVRQKLRRGDFEEEIITQVIERLHALSYLNDADYARAYAQGRFANRGYGPQRIRADLKRRGVASQLIEEALHEVLDADETLAQARMQAEKRWARLAREPDARKRRKKLADFLVRRGFSFDTVRRVIDELEED